ncbi:MAG: exonuclease SbcCD subunit D [Clostridiales bacterium]|nr:exonuclease SbcCD subunit D [Clostridiales bacterium]
MKFIHIADVHLGAVPDSNKPWGEKREKEIWESFDNIITICNLEKVDLLLIAGDLFHKQPLVRELKELNYYLSKLKATQVVIMAGNHDCITARSNYPSFQWEENVHMFLDNSINTIVLPEINTEVYGLSYHTREVNEALYDKIKPIDKQRINILLAHGGENKYIPMDKKKLQQAGFDYVALGHIHKPEIISDRMAYAGSLEPLDRNEIGDRGYIIGEINKNNDVSITHIRFVSNSIRQYKRVNLMVDQDTTNGQLQDQALRIINDEGSQHIYTFFIQGMRDVAMVYDKEAIMSLGNVLDVIDQSVPDYDFDQLYIENSDNIIGLFIKKIRETENHDIVTRKALYYGIEALLGSKGN